MEKRIRDAILDNTHATEGVKAAVEAVMEMIGRRITDACQEQETFDRKQYQAQVENVRRHYGAKLEALVDTLDEIREHCAAILDEANRPDGSWSVVAVRAHKALSAAPNRGRVLWEQAMIVVSCKGAFDCDTSCEDYNHVVLETEDDLALFCIADKSPEYKALRRVEGYTLRVTIREGDDG